MSGERSHDEIAMAGIAHQNVSARCDYCGDLGWTLSGRHYGRLTHKHACPFRTEPWCQTHHNGDCPPVSEADE